MRAVQITAWAFLVCLSGVISLRAQDPPPYAVVGSVTRADPVVVTVSLHNPTDGPLLIPYCGSYRPSYYAALLCPTPTRLEVKEDNGWRPARHKTSCCSVIGYPEPDRIVGLPAQSDKIFVFLFDAAFFGLDAGDSVRLVVAAYPDEASMKAGSAIRLVSQPFVVPPHFGTPTKSPQHKK